MRIFTPVALVIAVALFLSCGEEDRHDQKVRQPAPQSGLQPTGSDSLASARRGPPNLILITLDTTRADALGSYGQGKPSSPHIDKMAAEGVIFEHTMTTNPETLPSHASIFTGRWPYRHGVRANAGFVLPEGQLTLAEILKDHGYRTAAEIAAPVLRKETRITQGFDHYRGPLSRNVELKKVPAQHESEQPLTRSGADITQRAEQFMRRYRNEPFFLWLHYFDAHDPYHAPPDFRARFESSPYHAEVAYMDEQVGKLLKALDDLDLADDTLIILTADHGEGLNEHGEPTHSYFVYDTTMRVPLVFWSPGRIPAGIRITALARTIDILPTALEILGVEEDPDVDGRSLVPLIRQPRRGDARDAYGEATRFAATFGLPTLRYLRRGDWKYIHKVNPELYHVKEDPSESTNLASEQPERVEAMRQHLKELLVSAQSGGDAAQSEIDAQVAAELIALGYVAHAPRLDMQGSESDLELFGADPNLLVRDAESMSVAQGYLRREMAVEALLLLEEVHSRTGDTVHGLELRARALTQLDRTQEAMGAYESLLAIQPCEYKSRAEMGSLLRQRGQWEALVVLLDAGVKVCPNDNANRNDLAWALSTLPEARLRDGERAVSIMQNIIDGPSQSPQPAYLDTFSAALAESGRFAEAEAMARKAVVGLEANSAAPEILDEVRGHVEAYRRKMPVRDPRE